MSKMKTEKFELLKGFSYELRFYCDKCNEEVTEDEQESHRCGE